MKKASLILLKITGIFLVLFVGIYFIFRSITIDNLEDKLSLLNKSWTEVIKLQNENVTLLKVLINSRKEQNQNLDSLKTKLSELSTQIKSYEECNSNVVYDQYLLNKYMLPLLNNYSRNDSLVDIGNLEDIKRIKVVITCLNKNIEEYNQNVSDYNSYRSTFPIFLIARSQGFEYKSFFEILYGVENKDPKEVKKERREWQRKIEEQHGFSE